MTQRRRKLNPFNAVSGGLGSGLAGGLVAGLILCPPVLAVVLGLGGSAFIASLEPQQTMIRLAIGLVVTVLLALWSARWRVKSLQAGRITMPYLLLAVGTYGVAYVVLANIVTPLVHGFSHALSAPR